MVDPISIAKDYEQIVDVFDVGGTSRAARLLASRSKGLTKAL